MKKATNPGFAKGIAKRSPLERLAWVLKGAETLRKKDLRLNSMAAITEGRKIRERVTDLMLNVPANPEDARVYCVFAQKERFAEMPETQDPSVIDAFIDANLTLPPPNVARLRVTDELSDLRLAAECASDIPVGFLIFIWDRDSWSGTTPHNFLDVSMRPLLVEDSRATGILAHAMRLEKKKLEKALKKNAGVLPD